MFFRFSFYWAIFLQFQLHTVFASENPAVLTAKSVSFYSEYGTFTEQYIPESRLFSIQEPSSESDMFLVIVYPFFQELTAVKNTGIHSSYSQEDKHALFDELFYYQVFRPNAVDKYIYTFNARFGQDVVWFKWIAKSDSAAFFKSLKIEIAPDILRELVINHRLSYIHSLDMNVVEAGRLIESKPGKIFFSTTTNMKAGDCYAVVIPHQPFNPDSIKARTILYVRDGIETKIYTDDVHLIWEYADVGAEGLFIAQVQHRQLFGADLSFELYSKDTKDIPDVTLLIAKKNAAQQARNGYNAKGLYQADRWHKYIQALQKEFNEQQIAEQLKRKEELSTILSGRTFKLAVLQNGQFKEITPQPGSVIYQINDRFFLIMNPSLDYALLDVSQSGNKLDFAYSKAEFFPSINLLVLTGKNHQKGLILQILKGEKTFAHFTSSVVRNHHLYASTANETLVFSADGFLNRIPPSEKVLFESPGGRYYAVKNEGRGEIYTAEKQRLTSPQYYFTQFGSVDDEGIVLGKANQAIADLLKNPALVQSMHFYKFKNSQPHLVAKAGCADAQYLGGGKLACKYSEYKWHLYNLSGIRLESQEFSTLDNLLAKLQINKSELIWNKELRPAALKAAKIHTPEKNDLISVSNHSSEILGLFGPPESRIWVLR